MAEYIPVAGTSPRRVESTRRGYQSKAPSEVVWVAPPRFLVAGALAREGQSS